MDLEQSIARHDEQIDKILRILETTVERQSRLDNALVDMASAVERMADAQRATDERIEKLVSGIGEFLRRSP